jgi:hypothetical protein
MFRMNTHNLPNPALWKRFCNARDGQSPGSHEQHDRPPKRIQRNEPNRHRTRLGCGIHTLHVRKVPRKYNPIQCQQNGGLGSPRAHPSPSPLPLTTDVECGHPVVLVSLMPFHCSMISIRNPRRSIVDSKCNLTRHKFSIF